MDADGIAAIEITNLIDGSKGSYGKSKSSRDFSRFVKHHKDAQEEPAPARAGNSSGQKLVAGRVTKAQWERLRHYCIANDTSVQTIISEALADWFRQRGLQW
jgi:hypothetical protein